jgi:hypothetical protein
MSRSVTSPLAITFETSASRSESCLDAHRPPPNPQASAKDVYTLINAQKIVCFLTDPPSGEDAGHVQYANLLMQSHRQGLEFGEHGSTRPVIQASLVSDLVLAFQAKTSSAQNCNR